jgi:uncharacterized membrane protein
VKARQVVLGATALALATSVATYPWLPATMPTHFDLAGRADGFAPRAFGAFFVPALLGVMLVVSYVRGGGVFGLVLAFSSAFFVALHVLVLRAVLGDGTLGSAMWVAVGAFFVATGLVLPRVRRNRWVGVRTPWAMRSPETRARTQRVGGDAMIACGALVLLSAPADGAGATALRGLALLASALVPVVYSYWASRGAEPS